MLKNLVPPILSWYGASCIATRLELIADLGLATWFVQAEIVSDLERSLVAEWSPLIPSVFDPLRFKGLGMEPLETDQGAARHAWAARVAQPTSASVCRVAR